jgi:subtilisin family serine protease
MSLTRIVVVWLVLLSLTPVATAQPNPTGVRYEPLEIVIFPRDPQQSRVLEGRLRSEGFLVLSKAPLSGTILAAWPVPGLEEMMCEWVRTWPEVYAADRNMLGEYTRQPLCPLSTNPAPSPCAAPYPAVSGSCATGQVAYPPGKPNDPGFCFQWGLANVGQIVVDQSCALPGLQEPACWTQTANIGVDVNVLAAWERTTGSPLATVAVLDSGVEYCNPDFDPNRFLFPDINTSCIGNASPSYPCCPGQDCDFGPAADSNGHGTRVASIVGAVTNNEIGIAGVDQQCRILSARIEGTSNEVNFARVLDALERIATDPAYSSVRVINMSFLLICQPGPQTQALTNVLNALKAQNRVCISTSTNFGIGSANLYCPNSWPQVITVGGIDSRGWRYANPCGFSSGTGSALDFMAPGMADFALVCQSNPCPSCPYTTQACQTFYGVNFLSGSSFAAPVVAGAVSLILARAIELEIVDPETWQGLTVDDIYLLLRLGARDRVSFANGQSGDPNDAVNDDGVASNDPYSGWGMIDIDASLEWLELLY